MFCVATIAGSGSVLPMLTVKGHLSILETGATETWKERKGLSEGLLRFLGKFFGHLIKGLAGDKVLQLCQGLA